MDAGARVRLGQDDRVHRAGLRQVPGHQRAQRARCQRALRATQDTEARAFDRLQDLVVADFRHLVFATTEKCEILIRRPAQESLCFGNASRIDRHLAVDQIVGEIEHALAHGVPVGDAGAHVFQSVDHRLLEAVEPGRFGGTIDFEMHDGFGHARPTVDRRDPGQQAPGVAHEAKYRMDHRVNLQARIGDRHTDRVDQKRHVIGHHLDDGARYVEAALSGNRVENPHLGRS